MRTTLSVDSKRSLNRINLLCINYFYFIFQNTESIFYNNLFIYLI